MIVDKLQEFGLDLNKCRGQGHEIEELAIYIHCAAHNLNLVINDAVGSVTEVANYFAQLQSLYVFFGQSINRWDILSSLTGESDVTLKNLIQKDGHQNIYQF